MALPLLGLIVATIGLIWYWRKTHSSSARAKELNLKEFPGPRGLPLIGNALDLGNYTDKQINKWTDEYGDMFQVKLGPNLFIVVADPKLAKEILSHDPLITGRQHAPEFDMYEEYPLGMFNSEGERWEVHRRFLLRQLRDFGFGKSSMENLIQEEVDVVLAKYRKLCGKPITGTRESLRLALVNSLWTILSSQRFDHDDPELLKLSDNTSKVFNDVFTGASMLLFAPWLKHIFPGISGYNAVRQVLDDNRILFEKTVEEHKKNFDENDLKDFIDVFIAEMKKTTDTSSMFYGELAEKQLVVTLFDTFFAGSDSTAITISWAMLYLCTFPEVQKKLQAEIMEVTGNTRKVSVQDRSQMPYAQALIDEILRYSSIVPDGVPHRAMAERQFYGYYIPKDALVMPNMIHMHFNPKYFPEPHEFRPERFLSADGKKYVKNDVLQPFQVGRRQCVGESLARDTVFLYTTNLFQNFDMIFDPTEKKPNFESELGFLRAPLPFTVIMSDRLKQK